MRRCDPNDLKVRPFHVLDREYALLVAGVEHPNPMTVSWGGMGTLWNKPVVTVYVRPTRHTYGLMNATPEFTLNFLPDALRGALDYCGSRSGRDGDKWDPAGIHPLAGEQVKVPRVAEARLAFECRTLASFDFDPARFLDPQLIGLYPRRDFHRAYVGEVIATFEA